MAKVLYDFNGQRDNELSIKAGEMIEIVQKENNGEFAVLAPYIGSHSHANPAPSPNRLVARKEQHRASLGSGRIR